MPAAGGRQRDSLQVLPVFSTRVKAEVLMQRFLKLCRRGRIGRKSPALDTGSGAAALLTVASLPLLLLTLSRLGAPLWCHNCLQALFADWYFASVGSSVLCAKCILGHPPLPNPPTGIQDPQTGNHSLSSSTSVGPHNPSGWRVKFGLIGANVPVARDPYPFWELGA